MGSELLQGPSRGSDSSLCPAPMPQGVVLCTLEPRAYKSVHKKHNTRRVGIRGHSLLRCYALSGRLDATFHGGVNFAFTEFSEVAPAFVTLHTWLRYVTQRGRRVPPSLKEVG